MKSDSQANKVYLEMRRKILSNQLAPGSRLKEDEWARRTDVSRISVREALNRLLGEELVVFGEKGGFFIRPMTADDVREIRQMRQILEIGALRILVQNATPENITELEEICEDFSSMIRRGYLSGACEADVKFHETLIASAGNKKLITLYQVSNIPLFHQKLGQAQSHMDDYELTDKEHREIVRAIKEGNLAQAETILNKHLLRGEAAVLDGVTE